jgi:hypothetical protein
MGVRILILNYKGQQGKQGKGRSYAHCRKGMMGGLNTAIFSEEFEVICD